MRADLYDILKDNSVDKLLIAEAKARIDNRREQVLKIIGNEQKQYFGNIRLHFGRNNCPNSPIGKCIENLDNEENECIFCGLPDERK